MYGEKGAVGSTLIMMGLLILMVILASMSISLGDVLSEEADTSIGELNRIVQAKSNAQLYFYNYVPSSASYSAYEEARGLAREGGGEDIYWNTQTFNDMTSGGPPPQFGPAACSGLIEGIECQWEENTTDYLDRKYMEPGSSFSCERPRISPGVYFRDSNGTTMGDIVINKPLETTCSAPPQGETYYRAEDNVLFLEFNVSDARHMQAAKTANETLFKLYQSFQAVDKYTDSKQVCGSPTNSDYQTVLENAKDDAEQDLAARLDIVNASMFPLRYENLTLLKFGFKDTPDSLGYGVTTKMFEDQNQPTADTSSSQTNTCCNPGCIPQPNGPCIPTCYDYYHDVSATVKPEVVNIYLQIRDMKYKMPTENGWKRLNFIVDPYHHDFTKD